MGRKGDIMNSSVIFKNRAVKSIVLIFALTALTVTVVYSQGKQKEKKEDQQMPIFESSKSGLPIRDSVKKKKQEEKKAEKQENPPAKDAPSKK